MENKKAIIITDALYFIQKARVAAQIRETHLEKQGKKCDLTKEVIEKTMDLEKWLESKLADIVQAHPAYLWFSRIKGIGNINIGKVISLIDIEVANQISKLWRYAGFGCDADGKAERRKKGEKVHYNQILKSMCWRLGKSLIKAKGKYYDFYLKQKARLKEREESYGKQIISSAKLPEKNGKHIETDEFFGLGHIDMMAMRKMIKLFLSHLWLVWRETEGLKITKPYSQAIQGHSDFIDPWEMIEK
jgi:hypothetical protein